MAYSRLMPVAVVVVAVVAAASLLAVHQGASGPQPSTSAGSTTLSHVSSTASQAGQAGGGSQATATAASTGASGAGGASVVSVVEGEWRGTYSGRYGGGEWVWVVKRSEGRYVGCLKTSGVYRTSGWIPVTIEVEGDSIRVGSIGGGQVVFTGKISGARASGEWRVTGGAAVDGGSWEGRRVGDLEAGELPCMEEQSEAGEEGATTAASATTTASSSGSAVCTPPPPSGYGEAFSAAASAATKVLGALHCQGAIVMGPQYMATYVPEKMPANLQEAGEALVKALRAAGWDNASIIVIGPTELQVTAAGSFEGKPFAAIVALDTSGEGEAPLLIVLQPYTG